MERRSVKSRSIHSIGYDGRRRRLEVQFIDGGVYEYFAVPRAEHEGLIKAASIGAHMNRILGVPVKWLLTSRGGSSNRGIAIAA